MKNTLALLTALLLTPLPRDVPQTGYSQLLYGIDVHIGSGNPGAAAVYFANAEGSTIQDCTLEVGDGYTGLLGAPGSGGAIFNLTIRDGQIGAMLNCAEPNPHSPDPRSRPMTVRSRPTRKGNSCQLKA
jgi:hypothetical protein